MARLPQLAPYQLLPPRPRTPALCSPKCQRSETGEGGAAVTESQHPAMKARSQFRKYIYSLLTYPVHLIFLPEYGSYVCRSRRQLEGQRETAIATWQYEDATLANFFLPISAFCLTDTWYFGYIRFFCMSDSFWTFFLFVVAILSVWPTTLFYCGDAPITEEWRIWGTTATGAWVCGFSHRKKCI